MDAYKESTRNWFTVKADGSIKKADVLITESGITWTTFEHGLKTTANLPSCQILAATLSLESDCNFTVNINYVATTWGKWENVYLRRKRLVMHGTQQQCKELHGQITNVLQTQEYHRPKSVLIFVNPKAGNHKGVKIYKEQVKPLLDLCGVTVDVVVTKYRDEPIEFLSTCDVSRYDVVASMSGDGAMKTMAIGVLKRAAKDVGVDLNDPEATIDTPSLTISHIPSGSGNALSGVANGTLLDIETAVINIILGKKEEINLGSMHQGKNLIAYFLLGFNMGILSNAMAAIENLRMLGKLRYSGLIWPFIVWWLWQEYDVEIQCKTLPKEKQEFRYAQNVQVKETDIKTVSNTPTEGWSTFKGQSVDLGFTNWVLIGMWKYLLLHMEPKFKHPNFKTNKGLLKIDRNESKTVFFSNLFKSAKEGANSIGPPIAEQMEITEVVVKPIPGYRGCVVCDGDTYEIDPKQDILIKVSPNSLRMIVLDTALVEKIKPLQQPTL